MQQQVILENKEIGNNLFLLSFDRTIDFNPGQVVEITTHLNIKPRMYSIASGKKEPKLRILYNYKPGGELTPHLCHLNKGDIIHVGGAHGSYSSTTQHSYWIAMGTGIAPFASMFLSGNTNKTLIHGARTLDAFYLQNRFEAHLKQNYIRCITGEQAEGYYLGRVTQYLNESQNLPTNQKYYLCGSAEMVVECRDILISRGIPFSNIIAEIYF
jgi:ferredoxin--NADP+ reductase